MLYVTDNVCVNNQMTFRSLSAIFMGIFLIISACSLDVLETLHISEIDREQLRNQQWYGIP